MANLKEVRTRIASVNSTMQITSAMKMVSAAKLRRSQNAILTLRPYASKLSEIMQDLSSSLQTSNEGVYTKIHKENPEDEKILIIPVASNKGLCGIFNATVIRETISFIKENYQTHFDKGNVDILCISKKVYETLKFKKVPHIEPRFEILDDLTYDNTLPFAEELMNDFVNEKYDRIIFIYNQFKNAGSQVLVKEQFLPIVNKEEITPLTPDGRSVAMTMQSDVEYIFQPSKAEILETLVPKSLKLQVFKILLDSITSEHGARMVSMTKATDNAVELLKTLNLSYNKARQSAITNEIIEIVGGANAL